MVSPTGHLDQALDELRSGARVYLPGATGESLALREALIADPGRAEGVEFIGCLVPGMNEFDYASLHPTTRVTTFMMAPAMRASFEAGRVALLPLAYSQIATYLSDHAQFDVGFFQVCPPDADGQCSVGIAADFPTLAWKRAHRRVALINPAMPRPPRGPSLPLDSFDLVVDAGGALSQGQEGSPSEEAGRIADRIAGLIPDRAAIQSGIGGAPGAAIARLTQHRGLVIRSGMITDAYGALADAGALDPDGAHITGVAYGTAGFYEDLARRDLARFADTHTTHGAASLAGVERFVSINSALEVDLFGQVNSEWRGERLISGVGGGPDFVRAAGRSAGGLSIIALPATAAGGKVSRIVPRLTCPTIAIGRADIDTVVTEHGVASLKDLSVEARAQALIAIAEPARQTELAQAWAAMRARF
ncbi:MAG: acetyl-CoA hydrolase/transferase C-terminal domain-containing protein [Caulobacteraceae bacterium]|nr:acetyl-CoA hydrolase/transferase C-terminal domain-containing protein [Caulobacteraceae bacterium]